MQWIYNTKTRLPIKSWCRTVDSEAMKQAVNLANHPALFSHVALMPDCHVGYGMPIGGVVASEDAVIPNAVGVDIGCGMGAIETDLHAEVFADKKKVRELINRIKQRVPVGEGNSHSKEQEWFGFEEFPDTVKGGLPGWYTQKGFRLDVKNLGTLGGGNHFIELQRSESDRVWLMLHSGSRNLGHRIASMYHREAVLNMDKRGINIPHNDLAFLPVDKEGLLYLRDMDFALLYAAENRRRMMEVVKDVLVETVGAVTYLQEINIHHNFAGRENHFGKDVWVHRKGATGAVKGQKGIIPGSMGTASYIVEGLGNPESFMSCSHGAGRVLGRRQACDILTVEECDRSMEGIVFDRWRHHKGFGSRRNRNRQPDLSEAPPAYKDIDTVIGSELDLIKPLVKLRPVGVVKG